MPTDDEIRGLRRELAGARAKRDANVRAMIVAQLKQRGEAVEGDAPVERAVKKPGRPKKAAE